MTGYGTSVFDWKEGDQRTREYWVPAETVGNGNEEGFYVYTYYTDRYELMGLSEEGILYPTLPTFANFGR